MSSRDYREIVTAKRDGRALAAADVRAFVQSYSTGEVTEELAAAFLMAAFLRGLDREETLALTEAMVASGRTVSLAAIPRPTIDKHSTGGVADGVTLVFAPLVAALGLAAAKLSGRGLGHTGGTIDKLEAIPGFRADLTLEELVRQVEDVGCAVASQGPELVPVDGRLYALRDATATVESIPLIAASVMAKKFAVESDLILLDVKAGSGALVKTVEAASALAETCAALATARGRRVRIAVTDMSQPLGEAIGNALDVAEAANVLAGRARGRLRDLVVMFAGEALSRLTGVAMGEGRARAASALDDGSGLERFGAMVAAQGGDRRVAEDPWSVLPRAPVVAPLLAAAAGYLAAVDAEGLGRASGALGAGRARRGEPVDPAVGIVFRPKVGDRLELGQPIGEVHARNDDAAAEAGRRVLAAMTVEAGPVRAPPLVHDWLGG